jgi:hypothetical protein
VNEVQSQGPPHHTDPAVSLALHSSAVSRASHRPRKIVGGAHIQPRDDTVEDDDDEEDEEDEDDVDCSDDEDLTCF